MRKFLGVAAVAALVFNSGVAQAADVLKNLKVNGSIEVQGRAVDNANDLNADLNDRDGQVGTRFGLSGAWDFSDDVAARLSVYKNNRSWGDGAEALNSGGTGTGAGVLATTVVGEANVTVKGVLGLDHTIGRQYYGNPGDLLIRFGPSGGHVVGLAVTGVDGWRADWMNDNLAVTGLFAKTASGDAAAGFSGIAGGNTDTEVWGLQAMCNKKDGPIHPWVRLYSAQNHAGGARSRNEFSNVIGLGAKGETGALSYSAEVLKNFGDSPIAATAASAKGMGFLANGAFKQDVGAGNVKLMAEVGYGSGDETADGDDKAFRTVASDYRPGLIWGGLSNSAVTSLGTVNAAGLTGATAGQTASGLTTWNLGAKFNPAAWEKLWVGAHYYSFKATKQGALTDKSFGSEIDLTATWKHNDMTDVRFGYSMFSPGDGLGMATDDKISMWSVDLGARF